MWTAKSMLTLFVSLSSAQKCFYPDGSAAPDVPCNGTAIHSACCRSTAYCLSNGLCMDEAKISRGNCTDKTWASGSCAQYCQDSNPIGGCAVMACTNETFTCGYYPDNCATSSATFSIDNAGGIVLRDYQLTGAMQAAGVSSGSSVTASASASATASAACSEPASKDKRYSATSMAILGVVMAVVFILIIVGLVFMLFRERKLPTQVENEKDKTMFLQTPAYSPHQQQPTYAHYGAAAYPPQQQNSELHGGRYYSPQYPATAELDDVHVNELDVK